MDKTLAAALIRPLEVGATTPGGWTLQGIDIERSGHASAYRVAVYSFSEPRVCLLLRPAAFGGESAAETTSFMISVRAEGGEFVQGSHVGFREIVAYIRANDAGLYQPLLEQNDHIAEAVAAVASERTRVFVVPGHIGNLYDLSFRAVRVLQDVPIILMEDGKSSDLAKINEVFDIGLSEKTVIEFDDFGPAELALLEPALSRGQDLCLFGAGEGLPTICDPGWRAIAEFQRRGLVIRTLAGGGALAAALMRRGNDRPFSFWGLMGRQDGSPVIDHLIEVDGARPAYFPVPICFVKGAVLPEVWPALISALQNFEGELRLMSDLTRPEEAEQVVKLADLATFDPRAFAPDTKFVVIFEVQPVRVERRKGLLDRIREELTSG